MTSQIRFHITVPVYVNIICYGIFVVIQDVRPIYYCILYDFSTLSCYNISTITGGFCMGILYCILNLSFFQCNNPLTKEAKLTAAKRIVPEWTDYDNEIKSLWDSVSKSFTSSQSHSTSQNTGNRFYSHFIHKCLLIQS